jgi:tRNA(Ile)-lysidine synthase
MKTDGFLNKVADNIKVRRLISPDDNILVAFSGGPDSTALLDILHKLSSKLKFSLMACYINHKIRLRAVKKEIEFCRDFCAGLKIPFILYEIDIPKYAQKNKLSLEEAGYIKRKEILSKIALENKCDKIALGHHRDDIIETILFRLFRGTGPGGLQPIKPISGNIIRPLYNLSKDDILEYLKKNRISSVFDRSNLDMGFSRNYIRNEIIPAIEKHFGSGYRSSISNFAEIISTEDDYLNQKTRKSLKKITTITPGGKIIVDLKKISTYDSWLRKRMIKQTLERLSGHPGAGSYADIERINGVIESKLKSVSLGNNMRVIRERDRLFFLGCKTNIEKRELKIEGVTEIPELQSRLKCASTSVQKSSKKLQKGGGRINIDYDKVSPPCRIRGIIAGDKFTPLGMKGTKKVGDFLTDRKISRHLRDEIPVVLDKNGVIWLVGYQISNRVKIDNSTKRILNIEIT